MKNYRIYASLLQFVQSFGAYASVKELKDLPNEDIENFAKMYYLENA